MDQLRIIAILWQPNRLSFDIFCSWDRMQDQVVASLGMDKTFVDEKNAVGIDHRAIVPTDRDGLRATHYQPSNEHERRLDKLVNLKLDFIVVLLLALQFIFCGIDKTNIGFVATSTFLKDANLKPDDVGNSLSLFSATYVPLQLLMVPLARRVGVKYFLAVQLVVWGGLCKAASGSRSRLMPLLTDVCAISQACAMLLSKVAGP
jgi:hypothetical protein